MRCLTAFALTVLGAMAGGSAQEAAPPKEYPNSFGEVYWVPTVDQALQMAGETGRSIFLMGYSLVGDGSTYTKTSDEDCRGVF